MNSKTMNIAEIITGLNKNSRVPDIMVNRLESFDLTETEKAFFKKFKPENYLIIYGTLAPGKPNHHIMEHIRGEWQQATVKGKLENKGWGAEMGYYGFRHADAGEQNEIEAYVLFSDELVANRKYLDDFEGSGYKRILASYKKSNGETGVGYIYAIADDF
ncbi:gamma-glutamylcyclotransferase family protein [Flavobacterium sp. UBA4197]|uniref:gamma-glutamylcyclotransferase family protein n=1 Tax=Flavobacterium sp. UBA4197 TaxID=1946546 RepID=UPI00257AF3B0|nr:gamma-glutamylcyclotransferase [Flavobacterium sp. UBA4197]